MASAMTTPPPDRGRVKEDSYWSKLAIHTVPNKYIVMSAFCSYIILALAYLQGVTPWVAFGLAFVPWLVIVFFEIEWSYEHFGWFALFATMAFVQTIHYSEHCIEVIQVHIFHTPTSQALAIFSKLNVEGVHFFGDTFLSIGTLLLLWKFPRNKWLWVAIPFQILHQAEHTYLMFNYVFEGTQGGGTGLLASPGGALWGGVGLNRPDLHWIYNTAYTIPFVLALVHQLKHSYDKAIDQALKGASREVKEDVARHLQTERFLAGQTVLTPDDDLHRLYIVSEGEAIVYQHDKDGRRIESGRLTRGQYFGEVGLLVPGAPRTSSVVAATDLTVLAMDETEFRHLMQVSHRTEEEMMAEAKERIATDESATQPAT
jgi:hypothetical protein